MWVQYYPQQLGIDSQYAQWLIVYWSMIWALGIWLVLDVKLLSRWASTSSFSVFGLCGRNIVLTYMWVVSFNGGNSVGMAWVFATMGCRGGVLLLPFNIEACEL